MRIFLPLVWLQIVSSSDSISTVFTDSSDEMEMSEETASCGCSNGLNRQLDFNEPRSLHQPNDLHFDEILSKPETKFCDKNQEIFTNFDKKMVYVEGGVFTMGTAKPMIPLVIHHLIPYSLFSQHLSYLSLPLCLLDPLVPSAGWRITRTHREIGFFPH
jgi:hypothetical protein